jgi:DNA-binding ferritin-like protein (Dps family)
MQKLEVPNWKILVQERRRWKELVEKAKSLPKELQSHNNNNKILLYIVSALVGI